MDLADVPVIEVVSPSGNRSPVPLEPVPFLIGRQADNHLVLRDNRASRSHARIVWDAGEYVVEDLNSRNGITVNGEKRERAQLKEGDVIGFGVEDSYELIFRTAGQENTIAPATGLRRLRSILEVARTLTGALSTDHVLASLLEAALNVTQCERGYVLLREGDGLAMRIGRDAAGMILTEDQLAVPRDVLCRALERRSELLSMTLDVHGHIVCVPLLRV